ncbi:hypothetical protein VTN31DRAFT_7307 [Thermomyces dupontii]|uniref:uncharacterized protein n=1 Tax=Talaromyces thermophilus TaxID=28565 RepID=UPI003744A859
MVLNFGLGMTDLEIQGYGKVEVRLSTPEGTRNYRLRDVAYVPDLATNVVSMCLLRKVGIWWDMKCNATVLRHHKGSVLAIIQEHYGQFVLEYNPIDKIKVANYFRMNKTTSWTKSRPKKADIVRWHLRLGHPGPGALVRLVYDTEGVSIQGLSVQTYECDACAKGKIQRQSRVPRDLNDVRPGERIAVISMTLRGTQKAIRPGCSSRIEYLDIHGTSIYRIAR